MTKHNYNDNVSESALKRSSRHRLRGKERKEAYGERLKPASFIGADVLSDEAEFEMFLPAGGSGKAIMILNVTLLAIRANADPHTLPEDHMLEKP